MSQVTVRNLDVHHSPPTDPRALKRSVLEQLPDGAHPLRYGITAIQHGRWHAEVDYLQWGHGPAPEHAVEGTLLDFHDSPPRRSSAFNVVMVVPTGVDCRIGGHAGDATPAARLLGSVCDNLIVHPNVVNASDINEMPEQAWYVEGGLLAAFMQGQISLSRPRSNRTLVVTDKREDPWFVDQVVNTASAAAATLGADIPRVLVLDEPIHIELGTTASGRAVGEVRTAGPLLDALRAFRSEYDAVGIASRISAGNGEAAAAVVRDYFTGEGANPWGGAEAALTHLVSRALGVPSAHAPVLEALSMRTDRYGQVDAPKAAEAISTSFFFCVLKGLHRAPRVQPPLAGDLSVGDVDCIVVPQGCVGVPTLAAAARGIPIVAVADPGNLMGGALEALPAGFQTRVLPAANYLEAAGLCAALRSGVDPGSMARPLPPVPVTEWSVSRGAVLGD